VEEESLDGEEEEGQDEFKIELLENADSLYDTLV
jgi:hypothetical protein